ncbi:3-oxoacyl-ACP reductase [Microbacterium mangrovi]|uniref:3-oxoacyl-ACP reductase n=1 Tax=Microbacterium mangrovi TaxID=1348253 RepID=A0A0B2A5Q9_9MICO|nr:3-oxoacyl-ACP reductase FabG [Microbacterium mangrovi]KHK98809.1 3-oxoacyl-ACP reductase [Microbacterium mangrovi]
MLTAEQRIAIVTGAARGIGAAIAQRLVEDGLGVALLDLDERGCMDLADRMTQAGGRAIGVGIDVTNEQAVTQAVERVTRELGAPTVLVNNAGVIRDNLLVRMSLDDWETVMAVHLRGAFLMTRAAQAQMVEERWGRIINISSTSALGNRGQANYAAAKAGIQGFTKTAAIELGRFGVTANAIAPGFIETEMTHATAARIGITFGELSDAVVKDIPAGRAGIPEDIAHAVSFFASEDASFVSGQVLYVAGGPKA